MTAPTTERPPGLWLAEGVELLGEYQGSGLTDPPYLIRRGDGHTIQVSRLVYLVAEALSTQHFPDQIAPAVSESYGREVSVENVLYLVETKLGPVGLVPANDPEKARPATADPLLALRLRLPLIPERVHRALSTALTPLFWAPVIAVVLGAVVLVDIWLVTSQGGRLLDGVQTIIYQPQLLLVLTALTLVAGAFHELGHAAAARYGGAAPGAMGAGVYIVWPVFYTDVSDTYRLDRRGRLRTDLGGVYFNLLATLATAGLFVASGFEPLLVLAVVLQFETLRQFLPFVRLDGYYVMTDLAGVPNLFSYMKPVLTVLVRRGDADALRLARHKLGELTTRARVLIVGWVVVTAPVLALNVVLFLVLLPRLAGAAWGSAGYQFDAMTTSSGAVSPIGVVNGVLGMVLLSLPVLGMTYLLTMILHRIGKFAAGKWAERPALTGAASGTALAALVLHVGLAWPSGFVSALSDARDVTGGRAGADPLGVALGSDLPHGLTGLAPTAPPVGRELSSVDDDKDEDGNTGDDPTVLAGPAPAEPGAPTAPADTNGSGDPSTTGARAEPVAPATTPAPEAATTPSSTQPAPGTSQPARPQASGGGQSANSSPTTTTTAETPTSGSQNPAPADDPVGGFLDGLADLFQPQE